MKTLVSIKPTLPAEYSAQSQRLQAHIDALKTQNVTVIQLPAFELVPKSRVLQAWASALIQPFSLASPSGTKKTEQPYVQIAVFVSPSALEFGLHSLNKQWPEGWFCGVMGHQSALIAESLGVPQAQILAPAVSEDEFEDSEGLLKTIRARFPAHTGKVLICKGPHGRNLLTEALLGDHYDVQEFVCYERQPVVHESVVLQPLWTQPEQTVFWVTSGAGMAVLDVQLATQAGQAMPQFRQSCTVLATHPRIASKCRELGYQQVHEIATGIQSLQKWFHLHTTPASTKDTRIMTQDNQAPNDKQTTQASASHATSATTSAASSTSSAASSAAPFAAQPVHAVSHTTKANSTLGRLGFILSIASLGLLTAVVMTGKSQLDQTRLALGERLQRDATVIGVLKDQIKESNDLYKDLKTRFDLLEQEQKEAAGQRDALQTIYEKLLANQADVSLTEINQLVSIAKRQLFLLGNLQGATLALSQASDLLNGVQKPSLMRLKNAIDKDLDEIRALPNVDLLALAITLDSVINTVETLPMLSGPDAKTDMNLAQYTAQHEKHTAEQLTRTDPQAPVWVRAWNNTSLVLTQAWQDIKSLVEITKVDSPDALFLSNQQAIDIRNSLRLALLNGRISLLSRHSNLLQSDLDRAEKLLTTYFDPNAAQTQRAHKVMRELREVKLNLAIPELENTSSALRLAVVAEGDKK